MRVKKQTVLLVDDEIAFLEMLSEVFLELDYTVIKATNAIAALNVLKSTHIDHVILDFRLPGGAGTDVVDKMKAAGLDVSTVIFVTGSVDLTVEEAKERGVKDLLRKPFSIQKLLDAIFYTAA